MLYVGIAFVLILLAVIFYLLFGKDSKKKKIFDRAEKMVIRGTPVEEYSDGDYEVSKYLVVNDDFRIEGKVKHQKHAYTNISWTTIEIVYKGEVVFRGKNFFSFSFMAINDESPMPFSTFRASVYEPGFWESQL